MLAAQQGRAALCRRHARGRGRLRTGRGRGGAPELAEAAGVEISGLGYYPNPLTPDRDEARVYLEHLQRVIARRGAAGRGVVNTFVGRDLDASVDDNWPRFLEVWRPLVQLAEAHGVRIGIENCPMLFTRDEWPGGKNLAHCPAVWRRMFHDIPSRNFGLNYDPSHLVWQQIDYVEPLREFREPHLPRARQGCAVDRHRLNDVGILATPLEYPPPKLPGLGDVDWGRFFSVLSDIGLPRPVCVEVEDRAYEADSLASPPSVAPVREVPERHSWRQPQ